jgi:dTDP-4-amino-4,6-dideoxygalactose transaminase
LEGDGIVSLGPQVDAFEREMADYMKILYVLAVSSEMAVMYLAVRV